MKYFYNPEFGLMTKKKLLLAQCDVLRFYHRGLNSARFCMIVQNIIPSADFVAATPFTGELLC